MNPTELIAAIQEEIDNYGSWTNHTVFTEMGYEVIGCYYYDGCIQLVLGRHYTEVHAEEEAQRAKDRKENHHE